MASPNRLVLEWSESNTIYDLALKVIEGKYPLLFTEEKLNFVEPLLKNDKATMVQMGLVVKLFEIKENGKSLVKKISLSDVLIITLAKPWHNRYKFLFERELKHILDRELVFT